jgi:xanthine dehydrogenase/oxidase
VCVKGAAICEILIAYFVAVCYRITVNYHRHFNVNACLMPVLATDGCHVTTVEGIGTVKNNNLHPVQKSMVDMHGSQCGFCTPGIIVSLYTLLSNNPTVSHLEEHLDGNLCRCTGYRPIWDAARALCTDAETAVRGPCGTTCRECPERDVCEQDCNLNGIAATTKNTTMCCTSSHDKMSHFKDSFLANMDSWVNQPNDMFPSELMNDDSPIHLEISKVSNEIDRMK